MAILEIGITFQSKVLLEKQYYTANHTINKETRLNLLQTLDSVATQAFADEMQGFTLGEFSIIMVKRKISEPNNPNHIEWLTMYAIADRDTAENIIRSNLNTALAQFLDVYNSIDIFNKNVKKFESFIDRIGKIFRDLILKNEDRFKSLF
jgi:hypothetical protein